eukprot:gene14665-20700_t
MPKPRSSERRSQNFHVSPWQEKDSSKADEPSCAVEFVALNATPRSGASELAASPVAQQQPALIPKASAPAQAPQLESGGWLNRKRPAEAGAPALDGTLTRITADAQDVSAMSRDHNRIKSNAPVASSCGGGVESEVVSLNMNNQPLVSRARQGSAGCSRTVEWNSDEECEPSGCINSWKECTWMCHLAILPSGQVSGHMVDGRSRCCLGVVGRRLFGGPSARAGCKMDEDTEILLLQMIHLQSGSEVQAMVSKTGGDLARMEPAELWQIRRFMPDGQDPKDPDAQDFSAQQFLKETNPDLLMRHGIPISDADVDHLCGKVLLAFKGVWGKYSGGYVASQREILKVANGALPIQCVIIPTSDVTGCFKVPTPVDRDSDDFFFLLRLEVDNPDDPFDKPSLFFVLSPRTTSLTPQARAGGFSVRDG